MLLRVAYGMILMKVFLLMVLDGCALSVRLLDIHNNRHGYLNRNRTINILRMRMRKGDAIFLMGTRMLPASRLFSHSTYTHATPPHIIQICESCVNHACIVSNEIVKKGIICESYATYHMILICIYNNPFYIIHI